MFSLRHLLRGGIAIAILSCATPVFAKDAVSSESRSSQIPAAQLGGTVTPSNPALFEAKPASRDVPLSNTGDSEQKSPANPSAGTVPLEWQSDLLDAQRRSQSGFPVFNLNID